MTNLTPQDEISISLSARAQAQSKLMGDLHWAMGNILDSQFRKTSEPRATQKAQVKTPVESTPLEQPLTGAITPTSRKIIEEHSSDSSMRQEGADHHPTPEKENLRCFNSTLEN